MAVRTTAALVKALLGHNYHSRTAPDVTPFIDTATVIVDRMISDATAKSLSHTDAELELIERWLAAYKYCAMDPLFASKSTAGASASYVASQSLDGEGEWYKRGAIEADHTGCLNALLNRKTAGARLLRVDDPYRYNE